MQRFNSFQENRIPVQEEKQPDEIPLSIEFRQEQDAQVLANFMAHDNGKYDRHRGDIILGRYFAHHDFLVHIRQMGTLEGKLKAFEHCYRTRWPELCFVDAQLVYAAYRRYLWLLSLHIFSYEQPLPELTEIVIVGGEIWPKNVTKGILTEELESCLSYLRQKLSIQLQPHVSVSAILGFFVQYLAIRDAWISIYPKESKEFIPWCHWARSEDMPTDVFLPFSHEVKGGLVSRYQQRMDRIITLYSIKGK